MTSAPLPTPEHDSYTNTAVEAEWHSDSSNQVRIIAWHTQRIRRSTAFRRQHARQLIALYLMLLALLAFALFLFAGSFLGPFLAGTVFLLVLGAFQIVRGGRLNNQAALRLASALDKAGGVTDTSGRWRFRIDQDQAVWEWLDCDFRVSQATPHLDPPEEFDHTLMFSARGMPLGLVPLAVLTPEQGRRIKNLCGVTTNCEADPSTSTVSPHTP